jgi:AcrR family transcriptional regulator
MARDEETNERLRRERKEKILDGSLKLFATRGLSATKIAHIAKECGMSQGLVYHYYQDKEEIFTELVTQALNKMIEACIWLEKQPLPASQKICMAIEGLVKLLDEKPENALNYLLIAHADLSEATPNEVKELLKEKTPIPHEVMTQIFAQGQREGTIKDHPPAELALLFWTTLKGLAIHKAIHGNTFQLPNLKLITEIFLIESDEPKPNSN